MLPIVFILDRVQQAANAVIASSAPAARLALAAQQLAECQERNNPRSLWLPGMVPQQAQWAPNPCAEEENTLANLQQDASGGKVVPAGNLGAAVAPQLATSEDPTPSMDPAIPMSEFTAPEPGMNNMWADPIDAPDLMDMIIANLPEPTDQEMQDLDEILHRARMYQLWCPWGGPGVHNLKWKMQYKPKNQEWIGKWLP
uniref:Nucleoprotein n=1 Tax=Pacific black duck chaphamaparvovirus TaxID=2759406 RepID=A0A7D6WT29_9VIRU|nr:nucleoprotein [Pacific black duck chaphamaparvovirus]